MEDTQKDRYGTETAEPSAPGWQTLNRMLLKYEAADCSVLSLVKGKGTKRGRKLPDQVVNLLRRRVQQYASEPNPTFRQLYLLLKADVLEQNKGLPPELHLDCPCENTVRAHCLSLPEAQAIGGRKRKGHPRLTYGPYGKGPKYHRFGERIEIDCWNIHLHLLLKQAGVWLEVPEHLREQIERDDARNPRLC